MELMSLHPGTPFQNLLLSSKWPSSGDAARTGPAIRHKYDHWISTDLVVAPQHFDPFRLEINVLEFPTIINTFRARESKTFNRSGAAMKPISPFLLLRVRDAMTISLSSLW